MSDTGKKGKVHQTWDPEGYARNARFVADLGAPVLNLLAPQAGERILDLGCGDGPLTLKIKDAGCEVTGVDSSAEQIEAAKALGLDAHVADGEALDFGPEFDAVFSNAALHWMKRPDRVIAGVWRALRPGGRFVAEMGGYGNVRRIHQAMRIAASDYVDPDTVDPWYFPTIGEYAGRLEAAGFLVTYAELIPRPTPLPTDMAGWLNTFGLSFLNAIPEEKRAAEVENILAQIEGELRAPDGSWTADYVRLRFRAVKPAGDTL